MLLSVFIVASHHYSSLAEHIRDLLRFTVSGSGGRVKTIDWFSPTRGCFTIVFYLVSHPQQSPAGQNINWCPHSHPPLLWSHWHNVSSPFLHCKIFNNPSHHTLLNIFISAPQIFLVGRSSSRLWDCLVSYFATNNNDICKDIIWK